MNYHAKKKGFATLFSFPFPKALFPHSHIKVFLHKGANQKLAADMPGDDKHFKGDVCWISWAVPHLYEGSKPFG